MNSLENDWFLFGKMKVHTGLKYSDVVNSFEGYFYGELSHQGHQVHHADLQ